MHGCVFYGTWECAGPIISDPLARVMRGCAQTRGVSQKSLQTGLGPYVSRIGSDAYPDRAGMVDGAKTVDCFDPRHGRHGSPVRENMGAVDVQLTPADLLEIETGLARLEIYGGRMDATQTAQIGQD